MNQLKIESISGDDVSSIELIAGLAERIWIDHYTPIIGEGQVRYMLENFQSPEAITRQIQSEKYTYYAAFWDGKLAGYCSVLPDTARQRSVLLSKIYVAAEFRRKGIAHEFIRNVLAGGCYNSIWLTVNKYNRESIAAYEKMGFKISESLITDIGGGYFMDDYKMVWNKN